MTLLPFKRDQFTWLGYVMLAYFAYLQSAMGPLVNFLRAELHLTYSEGGFHGTGYAIGMITAGVIGGAVTRRWGRRVTFWGGGAGMGLGALLLLVGQHLLVTVMGAYVMGAISGLFLATINATLSDQHSQHRAIALTEANIYASISSTFAPLLLGGFAAIGLRWRSAIFIALAAWIILYIGRRETSIPTALPSDPETKRKGSSRLPAAFWAYWYLGMCAGALEAGIGFWGADFLNKSVKLPLETASGLVSVMFGAMVFGRIVGSRLTRTIPTHRLVVGTTLLIVLGFPIFWLSSVPALNIVGLFIVGLGMANLFPLSLASATGAAPFQADAASAYISLGIGLSILVVPQLIGFIADRAGIHTAFGLIGAIAIVAALVAVANARLFGAQQA